jgi:site-specific recombinase XerD
MIKATIKMMLDGKPLSNGNYAVYLRILKDRKQKKISLGLHCKEENFINESFTKQHPNYQLENEMLLKLKSRALEIIRNYQVSQTDFTLVEFEESFRGIKKETEIKVFDFFDEIIDEMNRSGRIGNAQAYKDTKDSLLKFSNNKIVFKDITPTFLEKYEVFLRENGNKNGGIAFKMRELRAIFNKARKRKIISKDLYPFEEYKISKLKTESRKIALSLEEYKKIKNVDLSNNPELIEAYNYFMFSIYTRGMNFKDMMTLKWSDIQNNRIFYVRSKTKGKLNFEIIPPVQEILDFYKSQNRTTDYVFPILLKDDLTPIQIANRHHKVLRRYNSKLKKIAQLVGINKMPTSYVARHSFATILKMSGTPIEKISEMMGHTDVSITITYLKEFSNEDLDMENRKFIDL